MGRKIFISYRREDSKHAVGRLYEALKKHVSDPKRDIFMDIDNIPRGVDYVEYLGNKVAECEVLFAVIGPAWLTVKDPNTGARRLDQANDFVRIEIAEALRRSIPVVPLFLDDTGVPAAADLPESLKPVHRRNGDRLRHESFDADVARLMRSLPEPVGKPAAVQMRPQPLEPTTKAGLPSWLLLVGLALVVGAWFLSQRSEPNPASKKVAEAPQVIAPAPAPAPSAAEQAKNQQAYRDALLRLAFGNKAPSTTQNDPTATPAPESQVALTGDAARLEQSCNNGQIEVCSNLGWRFQHGRDVPQDYARARSLYDRACRGGNLDGCNYLGLLLQNGQGGPQDFARARTLHERACNGSVMAGCTNLGFLLHTGQGGPQDLARARSLYDRACNGGERTACDNLASLDRQLSAPKK